jgi:hypothetical protein
LVSPESERVSQKVFRRTTKSYFLKVSSIGREN